MTLPQWNNPEATKPQLVTRKITLLQQNDPEATKTQVTGRFILSFLNERIA